jgi:thiol:disulfide interchange protein DsbD
MIFQWMQRLLLCILCLIALPVVADEENFDYDDYEFPQEEIQSIEVELLSEETSIQPGRPLWLAIRLQAPDQWHSYWKHPGDVGFPTTVEWELPPGYTAGSLEWPYPTRFDQFGQVGFGYEGEVVLLASITPPPSIEHTASQTLKAHLRWLVCSSTACVPGEKDVEITLPISTKMPIANPEKASLFTQTRSKLPQSAWNVQASIDNSLIALHVHRPNNPSISLESAYFCPASKDMVDCSIEAAISESTQYPGHYTIVLKGLEDNPPSLLQGVLVLRYSREGKKLTDALDVHLPLNLTDTDHTLGIALAPPPKTLSESLNLATEPEYPPVEFEGGFALALLFAFVGGMILNLMPCVLPVISFKILGFVKMAGESRTKTFKHGLAFSVGVIVSFWTLASILLALQFYGRSVGWGFQLQEPLFVAALAAVLLLFGLSLFGLFEFGTSVTSWAGQQRSSGMTSSFLSGVLATAVATPCTGPFLGSAIGFAVTLPAFQSLCIFTAVGLGMALPYLILAAYPQLLRFLPKPGPWMSTFKELMGFFMLATVLWLVWVFAAQTNSFAIFLLLVGFFLLALGGWVYGHWGSPVHKKTTRVIGMSVTTLCMLTAAYAIFTATTPMILALEGGSTTLNAQENWEDFSIERIHALQKEGTPILIDFTAKWCLICQANHLVLSTDEVSSKLDELGAVRMKADWTRSDPAITEMLRKFGRNSVPLYLLYGKEAGKQPVILPQVLTPEAVLNELNKLS